MIFACYRDVDELARANRKLRACLGFGSCVRTALTLELPSDVSGVAEVLDRPLRLRDRKMVQHSGFGVSGSSL